MTPALLPTPPVDVRRFTVDGDSELESLLDDTCRRVALEVRDRLPPRSLEGILLGGGYGRGEGGVLRTPDGDRPYNDLEFYVGLRGHPRLNEEWHGPALHRLAKTITAIVGIDVEFKIISLERLPSEPITMFSYDLVSGHIRLAGDQSLIERAGRHQDPARIPDAEASRLLFNRLSGLLFAKEILDAGNLDDDGADFVGRNLAKARLGFGDAVLTVFGRYTWSCRDRGRGLAQLSPSLERPWLEAVRREHAAGVRFKLHPTRRSADERPSLRRELNGLISLGREIWLWLESHRLHHAFATTRDYAFSDLNKSPTISRLHNMKANLRGFGPAAFLRSGVLRYPRDRLMESLTLLLWESDVIHDKAVLRRLQSRLATHATNNEGLLSAYRRLWEKFR